MKPYHSKADWLSWLDELSANEFVTVNEFLQPELLEKVKTLFVESLPKFSKAGIGALNENTIRHHIRGDHTYWLDRKRDSGINSFWELIDEAMHMFNRYCFLSLSGYEFHFANYPPGTHYEKHLDQFNSRSNRMITIVIYLNGDWKKGDGGELEVFTRDNRSTLIDPILGRCVMFKSANVPHRVLQSHKSRYSLSGWLLHQPSALGQFFG